MVVYASDKIYFESDELKLLREIGDNNDAFKGSNVKSVNVSMNYIDYFYSKLPINDIQDIEKYNFVEYLTLRGAKEADLYSNLRSIGKELNNKDISKDRIIYLKYLYNNIKKYISKKKEYDEYYDVFFPVDLTSRYKLKLKEN